MVKTEPQAPLPLVAALGDIDEKMVEPILSGHADFVRNPTPSDLSHIEGIIVRAHVDVDQALLEKMPRLRVISRTGVGTERVDIEAAAARGIPVLTTPGSNTNAVAEGAMAHLLSLTKRLRPFSEMVSSGQWELREQEVVGDLEGGTLAILGYGRIGKKLASLAKPFGMEIMAYDPFLTDADVTLVNSVSEAAANASHISIHLPLTEQTRNLVNRPLIEAMKTGVILVNLSRGEVVDLDAALWGLETGTLGGLGLDVYATEPPHPHAVFDHPKVTLSPHMMGLTERSKAATFQMAARGVVSVLSGLDQ